MVHEERQCVVCNLKWLVFRKLWVKVWFNELLNAKIGVVGPNIPFSFNYKINLWHWMHKNSLCCYIVFNHVLICNCSRR